MALVFISSALKPCLAPSSLMAYFLLCSRKFGIRSHFAHISCYGFRLYTGPNSPWNRVIILILTTGPSHQSFGHQASQTSGTFKGRKSTRDRYNSTPEDVMDKPRALAGLGTISTPWTTCMYMASRCFEVLCL